ncbi:MAG: hypothetical protein CBC35_02230 [Planctomycetes bacterium TMED75]|nr:MAG: hypothetical protein CBC35_02230 [Planctomycetes bacterium TMED75]
MPAGVPLVPLRKDSEAVFTVPRGKHTPDHGHGSSGLDSGEPTLLERNLTALGSPGAVVSTLIREALPTPIDFEEARDGSLVGSLTGGMPLASRHQPLAEADRWADELDTAHTAFALVLGFGLGYHVRSLVERMRGTGIVVVFEPDLGLLKTVFSRIDCSNWLSPARIRILCDESDERQTTAAWSDFDSQMVAGTKILEHPPSRSRLENHAGAVGSRLSDAVSRARMTISTMLMRSLGTVQNELYNVDHYVGGSGVEALEGTAAGHLGIVVSAGPSLQRNLDLLQDNQLRNRCVIISAQTTLRPLLEAGIRPHYVTALDYHQISRRFYEGLTSEDVSGITLVALPQAHPIIADSWPGAIRWCKALVLDEILGPLAPGFGALPAASTVAHLSYHLARYLGCDPVALIGQDLGFTDGVYYSRGTAIDDVWSTELNPFNTIAMMEWQRIVRHKGMLHRLEDIHGRPILTDDQMLSYLRQFEEFFTLDQQRGLTTIDATEGGVRKVGAEVDSLQSVLTRFAGPAVESMSAVPPAEKTLDASSRGDLEKRFEQLSEDTRRLGELSGETGLLLEQLSNHLADSGISNRLFKQLESKRAEVAGLGEVFTFVDKVNRIGAFKRYLADRRIDVMEASDPLERQALQVERDLVNVRFFEEAAIESGCLLEDARQVLNSGSRSLESESRTRSRLSASVVEVDNRVQEPTNRVVALVPINPTGGGAGSRRTLQYKIGGQKVANLTLTRLASSRRLDQIVVMIPDDFEFELAVDQVEGMVPITIERCGASPFGVEHEAIVSARMFADRCWRGGISGMTVFDEVLAPQSMSELMERQQIDGAVLCGPDWPLVEIHGRGGIDELIDRWRELEGRRPFIFTQAPPGLGGCLVSKKLMTSLAQRNRLATVGSLLGYRPDRPEHDPIVGEGNLTIDPQVRKSLLRAVYDSPRTRYRMQCAIEPILSTRKSFPSKLSSRDIVDQLEFERRGGLPNFTPRHTIIELCTGRLSSGLCSPHREGTIQREAMTQHRFRRIISDLVDSSDAMITLGGVGDPLQHPHCIDFVKMALDAGIRGIHVRTELQCSSERVLELASSGAQIVSVDLNADSRESYRRVMGHDGFDTVIDRIKTLIGARVPLAGQGVGALALPWVVPRIQRRVETMGDIESFYERWQEILGTPVIDAEPGVLSSDQAAGSRLAEASNPERTQIAETFRRMTIFSDGSVPFAELDLLGRGCVGNVDEESVIELWRRVVIARRRALRENGPQSPLVRTFQS